MYSEEFHTNSKYVGQVIVEKSMEQHDGRVDGRVDGSRYYYSNLEEIDIRQTQRRSHD